MVPSSGHQGTVGVPSVNSYNQSPFLPILIALGGRGRGSQLTPVTFSMGSSLPPLLKWKPLTLPTLPPVFFLSMRTVFYALPYYVYHAHWYTVYGPVSITLCTTYM